MKHSTKALSILLVLGMPFAAQAACDRYANAENSVSFPATITVPTSLPVGALITSQAFGGPFPIVTMNCNSPVISVTTGRFTTTVPVSGVNGVYRTEVAGVGMRVSSQLQHGVPHVVGLVSSSATLPPGGYIHNNISMRAEFYKIGPIGNDTMAAGTLMEHKFNGQRTHHVRLNTSIRFVNPAVTCDLAAGDVNRTITFAPIKTTDLKNADFAGLQNFDLTANCTNATNVVFRFSGPPAPGNNLLFANSGTANGVALWMGSYLNGVQQTISPNANNVRTVTVSGNRAILPMRAAYHKNGTVGAGTLVSNATVNITYN